jgi:F0F1-type ATP synthase beta subunit
MANRVNEISRKVTGLLDQLAAPLGKEEYAEVLEVIGSDIDCRAECVKEELAEEEAGR